VFLCPDSEEWVWGFTGNGSGVQFDAPTSEGMRGHFEMGDGLEKVNIPAIRSRQKEF
jgi:hypothetical protein